VRLFCNKGGGVCSGKSIMGRLCAPNECEIQKEMKKKTADNSKL
jgi:hypothetical protein